MVSHGGDLHHETPYTAKSRVLYSYRFKIVSNWYAGYNKLQLNMLRRDVSQVKRPRKWVFFLELGSYCGGLHHLNPYTDNVRGLYSPPFEPDTENLWSIYILYMDSRFFYVLKVPFFEHFLPKNPPHKTCLSKGFFCEWEVGSKRQMKPILTWNQNVFYNLFLR